MRTILLLLAFAMAGLSGCISDDTNAEAPVDDVALDSDGDGFTDAQETDAGSDPADAASVPVLPETLRFTGDGVGFGDASSNAPCALGDAQCETVNVPIPEGRWRVTFTLHSHDGQVTSSGLPYGSDYELAVLGQLSTNPGDQAEVITGILTGPITEVAEIQTWHDVDGHYELLVEFNLP